MAPKFQFALKSDIGKRRSQNQDYCAALPDLDLFIMSDGMGGHQGGEIASEISVKMIHEYIQKTLLQKKRLSSKQILLQSIQEANKVIFQKATQTPHLQGMGTTTTTLLFKNHTLFIGHVGDSRCYYLKPKEIWQLTRDHSLVQEKLKAGLIDRNKIKIDQAKNIITRSLGFEETVEVEIYQMKFHTKDCFLICSDGLSGVVENSSILKIVEEELFENQNIQNAVTKLIQAANYEGGDDNVSVILIQVI